MPAISIREILLYLLFQSFDIEKWDAELHIKSDWFNSNYRTMKNSIDVKRFESQRKVLW